MYIKLKTETV